jgi:hypothetical protein
LPALAKAYDFSDPAWKLLSFPPQSERKRTITVKKTGDDPVFSHRHSK